MRKQVFQREVQIGRLEDLTAIDKTTIKTLEFKNAMQGKKIGELEQKLKAIPPSAGSNEGIPKFLKSNFHLKVHHRNAAVIVDAKGVVHEHSQTVLEKKRAWSKEHYYTVKKPALQRAKAAKVEAAKAQAEGSANSSGSD